MLDLTAVRTIFTHLYAQKRIKLYLFISILLISMVLKVLTDQLILSANAQLITIKNEYDSVSQEYSSLQERYANFKGSLPALEYAKANSLIGKARRAEWMDTALNIKLSSGMSDPTISLEREESVVGYPGLQRHRLRVSFYGVVETEVLAWIKRFRQAARTPLVIKHLLFSIHESTDLSNGLQAQLELELYNFDPTLVSMMSVAQPQP